jgi:hypothetical protein
VVHKHRAASTVTQGWRYCVAVTDCYANGYGDMYHGNLMRIETCRCGMKRQVESGVAGSRAGHWKVPGA